MRARLHIVLFFAGTLALGVGSGCPEVDPEDKERCDRDEILPEPTDICVTCICTDRGEWEWEWQCTEVPCEPCESGDTRPAGDGCNTCVCDSGTWACTEIACAAECSSNADCFVGGCSAQLCSAEAGVASTCEWQDEYACYASEITSCGCFAGQCQWEPTGDLAACLESPPCEPGEIRPADDGCNTCECTEDRGWACTEIACGGGECASDLDCEIGGCSGQLCAAELLDSDCAWQDEYACYQDPTITGCGCIAGQCAWDPTDALAECLESPPCVPGESRPSEDGCNTCTCGDDGSWVCTLRDCAPVTCSSDDDCFATGCSGQLCASEEIITTCEFLPEYRCYQDPAVTTCGCEAGVCHWTDTEELASCLADPR